MWSWIKGFFSTQPIGSPAYQAMRRAVLKELRASRPQQAMQYLGPLLGYTDTPQPVLEDPLVWRDAMGLFAKIAAALDFWVRSISAEATTNGTEPEQIRLADLLTELGDKPNNVALLVGLSSAMNQFGAAGIGAMFLTRALRISPNVAQIRDDLALMLMNMREYATAANILQAAADYLASHPTGRYILVRALLWQGKIDEASAQWQLAVAPQDAYEAHFYEESAGFMQRLDAYRTRCAIDDKDLRGWHFVLTGGILLHLSPAGREIMNGRYGMLFDNASLQLECIQRAAALLTACNKPVASVFALPDHDSQVFAAAVAGFLSCPVKLWPQDGTDEAGLIIAYSLNQIDPEILATLATHRSGQLFWAHSCSWITSIPVTPDLVSLLAEHNLSPWSEQRANFQGIAPQRTGAIEALADEILTATLEEAALPDLPDLCQWVSSLPALAAHHAPGIARSTGQRRVFFADSPVPSNSFRDVRKRSSA